VNLGLFTRAEHGDDAEWAAGRAARAFARLYRPHEPGGGLREALEHLKAEGLVPRDVLPPWVERVGEGTYRGCVKVGGEWVATAVVADAWEAYAAAGAVLAGGPVRRASRAPDPAPPRRVTLADHFPAA
jgi:hypothetical protein